MKKIPKIITIIFFTLLAVQASVFIFGNILYSPAQADVPTWTPPDLQIKITDNLETLLAQPVQKCGTDERGNDVYCINWIGYYIAEVYKYAVGIVGIIAAVVLMWGGIRWMTSGGSAEKVKEAQSWISASLTGLVLVLTSYLILYQINLGLTQFKSLRVSVVKEKEIQSTTKLTEGQECVPSQSPLCDIGLECKGGKCVRSERMQELNASGQYRWVDTGSYDCGKESKSNYGDLFCPGEKPGPTFRCCGKY